MENRFSRASSQRSATASEIDDALYPAYHHYRPGPSLAISTSGRRPARSPSRDYALARSSSPENVFADPADSPPPSPSGSAFYSNSIVTPTPSVRRPSLSLSARRSPSPLPGANGSYYQHYRLSQSLTPSVRSSASSTYGLGLGNGLNRSNTTGTTGTGYSTLSSIPSNLSDFTSPPSPLPPIAPVRPQWNYGGHQQSIYPESVNTGSVLPEEMDDPFADDFMIPVPDGFPPHQRPPAVVFPSGASSVGSIEPPPYTRYPDQPKPEDGGAPLVQQISNGDSGIDVGRDDEEDRRRSRRGGVAAVGGVGLIAGAGMVGGGGDPGDDGSGAKKEWNEKRWMGFKLKLVVLGLAIGLLVLLAVGLGVGLGVGLNHDASNTTTTSTVYPETTADMPPTSEETGPPLSSPNNTFPEIPIGLAAIDPLMLADESSACDIMAEDPSAPDFFRMGADLLWSCQSDQDGDEPALVWRFEEFPGRLENMEKFDSKPDFLRGAEYGEGSWGGYMVSSLEGIQKWEDNLQLVDTYGDGTIEEFSGKGPWKDGMQNQAFWRMPLAFYDWSENSRGKRLAPRSANHHKAGMRTRSSTSELRSRTNDHSLDDSYKFGVLFDKTIIIKESTIRSDLTLQNGIIRTGNGSVLNTGEIVWRCVWEKSLLEVEVMVDIASQAITQEKETDDDNNDHGYPQPSDWDHNYDGPHPTDHPYPYPTDFPDGPPPPPPPPPPVPSLYPDDDFFGLKTSQAQPTPTTVAGGNPTIKRSKHNRSLTKFSYPLKVSVKESRPDSSRIRKLLGMDLTDPDPKGRANPGAVKCTQYRVGQRGGLTPMVDEAGEGYVVLREQQGGRRKLREREDAEAGSAARLRERNGDCFCRWNS